MVTWVPRSVSTLALALLAAAALTSCTGAQRRAVQTARPAPLPPFLSPAALFVEPEDGIAPLISLINSAQHTVFVEAYIMSDARVVHALERVASQGVDVRVVLEERALGMGMQPEILASELAAAGIGVRSPPLRYTLDHAKFVVVDDARAWLSTANFSRSAFRSNREFAIILMHAHEVRALSNVFRHDWDGLPGPKQRGPLVLSPGARAVFLHEIASARSEIDLDEEELLDPNIDTALRARAGRGVRVRILLPSPPPGYRSLLRHHLQIRILGRPYMHAKVLLVDRTTALLGSQNISAQSLDTNREVGVALRGTTVSRLQAVFEQDWTAAQAP